jgi:hypothetical protein
MAVEKFEKTLQVPACYIGREIANRLAERIYAIAEDQAQAAYREFLIQTAPRLGLTPEQAIQLHAENRSVRDSFRKDRSTFISKEGSLQIEGREVLYDEIPGDPDQVIVDVPGRNGRYLNITLSTDLMRVFPLHAFNKIIIQGQEKDWVNGLYQEFESLFQTQKKVVRDFFYRWLRPFAFVAILFLSFIEFWIFRLVNPTFTAFTPLNWFSDGSCFRATPVELVSSFRGRSPRHTLRLSLF